MERTITFIAEDKKRQYQKMEKEYVDKATQPQQPQFVETEATEGRLSTS